MSPDGIHPNAAGARMIVSTILPFVRPLTREGMTSSIHCVTTPPELERQRRRRSSVRVSRSANGRLT
jgi:hypothetical protein